MKQGPTDFEGGKYPPGYSGNPKGRPLGSVGSLTRLIEAYIKPWEENPKLLEEKLKSAYEEDPVFYVKDKLDTLLNILMDKVVNKMVEEGNDPDPLTDASIDVIARITQLKDSLGKGGK